MIVAFVVHPRNLQMQIFALKCRVVDNTERLLCESQKMGALRGQNSLPLWRWLTLGSDEDGDRITSCVALHDGEAVQVMKNPWRTTSVTH